MRERHDELLDQHKPNVPYHLRKERCPLSAVAQRFIRKLNGEMIRQNTRSKCCHKKYTLNLIQGERPWSYHRPTAPVNHPNVKMVTPTIENKKP